ncbi:MAG: TlyA family rRNA (cytidine-2'-O)-methyltransferase [Planctomycetes bacterium]|nr:TlyA family rRNA (cytidine-2'-O)-methyltransferase [Planctomycetota bacterium]
MKGPFVSRAGQKLAHALEAFGVDPGGMVCADFGCNVGGFTDCLLQRGAARVFALDTGYGILDWTLRKDPRVVVMERTNAMHAPRPEGVEIGLVAIDMAWTPQRLAVPAALRWLSASAAARIVTLVKPHYESSSTGGRPKEGVLSESEAAEVMERVIGAMPGLGVSVLGATLSPLIGGGKSKGAGNVEYLMLLARG